MSVLWVLCLRHDNAFSRPPARYSASGATSWVGINELIKKSNVAKATFYQHFPSKETLCVEWLKHVAAQSEADAQDLLKSPLAADKKIANRFDDIGGFLKASSFRGCPFSNTAVVMLKTNAVRAVRRSQGRLPPVLASPGPPDFFRP